MGTPLSINWNQFFDKYRKIKMKNIKETFTLLKSRIENLPFAINPKEWYEIIVGAIIRRDFDHLKRQFYFLYQHVIYGYSDADTWGLDGEIARFVIPRLKLFKKIHMAHPTELQSKQWEAIIGKMIKAFEMTITDFEDPKKEKAKEKTIKDGMNLFSKYFQCLWW